MKRKITCAFCGNDAEILVGAFNRAVRKKARLFCGRRCFGLDRRINKTTEQKKEEKRIYDINYREANSALLKKKKRAFFQKTYDPSAAKVYRKNRSHIHAEYCRRPEYREWKKKYDSDYRAREYGPFAESYQVLVELTKEINTRMSKEEIYQANATNCKRQRRKREYASLISG